MPMVWHASTNIILTSNSTRYFTLFLPFCLSVLLSPRVWTLICNKNEELEPNSNQFLSELRLLISMGESSTEKRLPLPPFLAKCYEMVDDSSTDSMISWNPNGSSGFVIWDLIEFQTKVLPKFFKHGNFSSFMRQLNTYGFRKSDPDRWEFINDGFVKGQKHLLKTITRRKPTQTHVQQKNSEQDNLAVTALVPQEHAQQTLVPQKHTQQTLVPQNQTQQNNIPEVGKFSPWEEVEKLKQDKNILMQELVTLSQQQESTDKKLHRVRQRLKGMELNQQQMFSLLAMAMQSPGFLAQLLQQNEFNWCISEPSQGLLPALEHGTDGSGNVASERRIVKYQPWRIDTPKPSLVPIPELDELQQYQPRKNESPKPSLVPISELDELQQSDSLSDGLEELFKNIDVMAFADEIAASMEVDALPENGGLFVIPELPEVGSPGKLRLDFPVLENGERTEQSSSEADGRVVELVSTNHDAVAVSSPDWEFGSFC